jgi:hypothetical protein
MRFSRNDLALDKMVDRFHLLLMAEDLQAAEEVLDLLIVTLTSLHRPSGVARAAQQRLHFLADHWEGAPLELASCAEIRDLTRLPLITKPLLH